MIHLNTKKSIVLFSDDVVPNDTNLLLRVFQHKNGMGSEFALKYGCKILVYYFFFDSVTDAIAAEKKLKQGSRQRKIRLIESVNSEWKDLISLATGSPTLTTYRWGRRRRIIMLKILKE